MTVPWITALRERRGGAQRLLGLKVYYDFAWRDLFPDELTQFKHGLSLARHVQADCPPGKQPALLLTIDDAAEEVPIETDEEYVVVVRLRDYLRQASGDAAAAYYANRSSGGVTGLARFRALASMPEAFATFLDQHLTLELVQAWAAKDGSRFDALRAIGGPTQVTPVPAWAELVNAIRGVDRLDAAVWQALVDLLPPLLDDDSRRAMLTAITGDQPGRRATSVALVERVLDRMADAHRAASDYTALLAAESSSESDLQDFIQQHPWVVGLDYVLVRPRFETPRGELDFILERYDGFHDVLELKSPKDPIITVIGRGWRQAATCEPVQP